MSKRKICVITGANSGIGKATAMAIAEAGFTTVIIGRRRGDETVKAIKLKTGNMNVHFFYADFSSPVSIKAMAAEFNKQFSTIDVLINNAGGIWADYHLTDENIEYTFAVNHIGYFLTTYYFLDALKNAGAARIINVASDVHKSGKINFENINHTDAYSQLKAYSQSKLANIMFTYYLANKMEGTNVTVNCLHPGVVASGFGNYGSTGMRFFIKLLRPFLISPEDGAATSIFLALSDEVAGVSGKYFKKKKAIISAPKSYDETAQKQLWELTEKLTGVHYP